MNTKHGLERKGWNKGKTWGFGSRDEEKGTASPEYYAEGEKEPGTGMGKKLRQFKSTWDGAGLTGL